VAEVTVDDAGNVKVDRVVCAVDCGTPSIPSIIKAQLEGGIGFGLGAALYGAITLKTASVQQSNFNNYRVLRMNEMPKVEVYIVPSAERPTGVGEPGVAPIGPAVANAIFAATGKRLHVFPFSKRGGSHECEIRAQQAAPGAHSVDAGHPRADGLVVAGYEVFGPKPTDFAGGKRVALDGLSGGRSERRARRDESGEQLLERGEYLTRAADCAVCHTAKDGVPFAGGRAFVLPFGTLYSTNITPDTETGIGTYTDANFLDAVHRGIGRGNTKLYPAMPYASYTYMSDADALAIKAYLFSLKPCMQAGHCERSVVPVQSALAHEFWSAMFNPDKRFEPVVDRGPDWNRGAYLVEAMGHCGECHTPRNLFFALNNRQKFAGAVQAGWRAYNITPDMPAAWARGATRSRALLVGRARGRPRHRGGADGRGDR
jgi:mono/diheme cytochrome c family protein